jgi:hypothetical protein
VNSPAQHPTDPTPTVCVKCGNVTCTCDKVQLCRVPLCLVSLREGNETGLCDYHLQTERPESA